MKKLKYLLLVLFLFPLSVYADNIYSRNMDIYITKEGTANVTETWDVKADSGSEWYTTFKNMGNTTISNYKVLMDGKKMTSLSHWDVSASLSQKSGKYGINYLEDGLELCFGKGDFKRHKFTVTYNINNIIFNVSDAQVLYNTFIPKTSADYFDIKIKSYYNFPNDLAVWGYGYKGYAYVKDGYVELTTDDGLSNQYVVALIKFPLNTFNTSNSYDYFTTFDDVSNKAKEGSFKYNYDNDDSTDLSWFYNFIILIVMMSIILLPILLAIFGGKKYLFKDNKTIPKNVNYFRDIPCNNDLKKAYYLASKNHLLKRNTNLLGCYLLKWIKEGIVTTNKNGKNSVIIFDPLKKPTDLDELGMFNMMYEASQDGVLEKNEFKSYCSKHYEKVLGHFDKVLNNEENNLVSNNNITTFKQKKFLFTKTYYVFDDSIYNDVICLKGLKKYFRDFTRMYEKMPIEVHLWQDYLIFAQLFGMADKVAKEFKNLYPDVITDDMYNDILLMNMFYTTGISSANSAKSAAEAYSSGGGGFSSGGGGGGSFGGGGSSGGR